ncbi:MAG: tyrosine-type recombinase/integrase [Sphingopyxis sp.]|jgi:integrase|uniref:tyrosine-type recombinase/integrase n=1 Tax=Sphingopyxis sp. TaxID=1908224 RepID=UPI001A570F26|nr:site-specific integrase [Sphingopyxis sp.]MBL9070513.1 tyrosine-type recombinase/integrase [Sphingopyxis sp.]
MATGKITIKSVEGLAPGPRDAFLWDVARKGFGVKITPAGRRIYILQYRMGGRLSPTKRYKIGVHGAGWTPELAGREADRLLHLIGLGTDPAEEKRRKQYASSGLTFDAIADRYELKGLLGLRDRSKGFVKTILRVHLRPKLGKRSLPSITGSDIIALLDDLPGESAALRRNVYAVVRRLITWAKGRGIIDRNPLDGFEPPPAAASRDRVLSDDELRIVWVASGDLGPIFSAFVRLLLLTGQRRDEVGALEWQELDRARAEWILPAARAKNAREHLVPLSKEAVALLDALAGGKKWPRSGFVLTTDGGKTRVKGFSGRKGKLDMQIANLVTQEEAPPFIPWRFHDLRRSAATGMQKLRIPGEWIEAVQNRRKPGVAGTYQRYTYLDEKREALTAWGAHVSSVLKPAKRATAGKAAPSGQ